MSSKGNSTPSDVAPVLPSGHAASAQEEQFRLLVDAVRDFAIFMVDLEGRITTWNSGAERLLGWTEAEAIGQPGAIIFTPEDRAKGAVEQELSSAALNGRAADERWHLTKDLRRFWGSGVMAARKNADNRVDGFVKILRDETLRKQSEDALVEAKRAAESANRMKDEFLATLGHELRTPLSSILLWSKMLLANEMKPEEVTEGLTVIKNSADAQTAMIDDLLDTSRIISGKLRLEIKPTDLAGLVQESVDAIIPAARSKEIDVHTDLHTDAGTVMADGNRISQVIWNLLTNAVKFTPRGGRIDVSLTRRSDMVVVAVRDTGQGISAEFLPHVFDRFRQEDSSSTRRYGGLGLGLNIAKQLVTLHGGTIDAESAGASQGATFTVKLPLPRARSTTAAPSIIAPANPVQQRLSKMRILVVEDEPATGHALTVLLGTAGSQVTLVSTSADAMKVFAKEKFDLILSDIGLPDEDGYALINKIRLRENERRAPTTPAIALTAFAREEDRQRALLAGFQEHLRKPIEPEQLLRAIRAVLQMK